MGVGQEDVLQVPDPQAVQNVDPPARSEVERNGLVTVAEEEDVAGVAKEEEVGEEFGRLRR